MDNPMSLNQQVESNAYASIIQQTKMKPIQLNIPAPNLDWKGVSRKKFQESSSSELEKRRLSKQKEELLANQSEKVKFMP